MAAKDKDTTATFTSIDDEPKVLEERAPLKLDVVDHGDNMTGERVLLTIQSGQDEAGRQAVFVSINGHGFNIPRGIPVEVPVEVLNVIEDAKMTIYEPVGNKQVEREVSRFSFSARPVPTK